MAQQRRFDQVDFSEINAIQITPAHTKVYGGGYRCNRGEFVSFWKQGRIEREITSNLCQCWALTHNNYLAGYITLLADKLTLDHPILASEDIRYSTYPAIKIGLLSADFRSAGVGKRLVFWAMSYVATELAPRVGVRFLTVDAFYDKDTDPHYDISGFYQKLGFEYVNPDENIPPEEGYRSMFYDLKSILDLLKE